MAIIRAFETCWFAHPEDRCPDLVPPGVGTKKGRRLSPRRWLSLHRIISKHSRSHASREGRSSRIVARHGKDKIWTLRRRRRSEHPDIRIAPGGKNYLRASRYPKNKHT